MPISSTAQSLFDPTYPTPTGMNAYDRAVRVVTPIWILASVVQFVVWFVVCVGTFSLSAPWFLWTLTIGGAVVAGLKLAAHSYRTSGPRY